MSARDPDDATEWTEADCYEVLNGHDVEEDPPAYQPVGPGDVFRDIELAHLADPFVGPVIVVGHPCSIRRGIALIPDLPVAPISAPGIPTAQQPIADKVFPVGKLLPPGSDVNMVVQLVRTTTVPAVALRLEARCASLNRAGVVALQQRVVGNQIRARVPTGVIANHCRGPLTELELWTDWRENCVGAGQAADEFDSQFDEFMRSESGFAGLSWREAIGEYEHASARALSAMDSVLATYLQPR